MQKLDSRAFSDASEYDRHDLGVIYTRESARFLLWAPTAEKAVLNLYRTGNDSQPGAEMIDRIAMEAREKGVWEIRLQGDWAGVYYTYSLEFAGKVTETADVYGKACGVNGERSMVVDLRSTDPAGFRENHAWQKKREELAACPVIYELHIRDFSSDSHSGISEKHRGKYLAFTEKDTTFKGKGEMPTGISWLKSLGITHVHLLPFFDYGSVDEAGDLDDQFNWGYDPVNYNIPEGSYSTDPCHGEVRIKECKQMIEALHQAGIGVVMDVVFNHTYSLDSVFQRTVPNYYYRQNRDGSFANGSLCGNDTASERGMFRSYMTDSVRYWAEEYQLDGFRFDLMGLHDVKTMNQIREALDELPGGRDILMYGEPWAGDYSPMEKGALPADKEHVHLLSDRIAVFSDKTRDAIKGDVFTADDTGFVNGEQGEEPELARAVADSARAWCGTKQTDLTPRTPSQIISYVSAHDNYTLWDKLIYTLPVNAGKKREQISFGQKDKTALKQNKMAAGICFTCLGTAFFQAGEEFARTKLGMGNSFNLSTELNALSWKRAGEYGELVDFYRGLISFRKEWSELYAREAEGVTAEVRVCETDLIAFQIRRINCIKTLFIVYNRKKEKEMLTLQESGWSLICDGDNVYPPEKRRRLESAEIIVKNQAVMILGKEE